MTTGHRAPSAEGAPASNLPARTSPPARSNLPSRVALVCTRYLPYAGGVERHVHEVGARLASRGVDVSVLTTDVSGRLTPVEVVDGILVRRFRGWPSSKDYHLAPGLLRALATDEFDLVHAQGIHTPMQPLALAIAQRRGIPTVLTFHTGGHSSRLRTLIRSPQWAVEAPILRRTSQLIGVCQWEAELFGRHAGGQARVAVVRNGSEPLPVSDRTPMVTGRPLILSVGRLERYKGHHRAIAAMPALLEQEPGAHLAVVGTGPYEGHLRDLVRQLGLDHHVSIVNFPPDQRGQLGTLVQASDALVLLSDYEANPIAVMEALAFGVDVLVADTSGLSELGDEGLATTIAIDASPTETARAIIDVARERRWAAGPPPLPTWDGCVDALMEIYRAAMAAPAP